jgi:hypothetical protein
LQWAWKNGCPRGAKIKFFVEKACNQETNYYYQRRWLQQELNIQWGSTIINWMNTIDKVLDTIDLIPELSNLIKTYV